MLKPYSNVHAIIFSTNLCMYVCVFVHMLGHMYVHVHVSVRFDSHAQRKNVYCRNLHLTSIAFTTKTSEFWGKKHF